MKTHTTDYFSTFIEVAEDCPVGAAEVPPQKGGEQTVAGLQYALVRDHPYAYTSDEVIFSVHAHRQGIPEDALSAEREKFFSKGQPCMRSSPLPKRYGWGVHFDPNGKMALVGLGTPAYEKLAGDSSLKHVKAMRSKRV